MRTRTEDVNTPEAPENLKSLKSAQIDRLPLFTFSDHHGLSVSCRKHARVAIKT